MPKETNSLVLSYLELRQSLGVIGMLLPLTLAVGKIIFEGPGILYSVSSYYYSSMGNVFVGSLCAIGVFLWSYRGYDIRDTVAGHLAALFAIGTALFPTSPDGATARQIMIGNLHLLFAAGFFLTLSYFALVLFTKTNPNVPPTPMKRVRNKVYIVSGITILLSIALIAVVRFLPADSPIDALMPIFWLESLAIVSFGVSWFVKGEAILKD